MEERLKELLIEYKIEIGNFGKNYGTGEYQQEFVLWLIKKYEVTDDHK